MSDQSVDIFAANAVYPDAASLLTADYRAPRDIISECDVVLDTNVLLTPYTTGKNSLEQLGAVYRRLRDEGRLHVPGQVAREHARWRSLKLTELYSRLADAKSRAVKPKRESLPILEGSGAYDRLSEAESVLETAVVAYQRAIDAVLAEIRSWSLEDPVTRLYKDVIGSAVRDLQFDPEELKGDLERRFNNHIPPGYKDSAKDDDGVGDLLIWRTILDVAQDNQRDLVFVTGEEKADWQHRADNRGLFPRMELVDEYRRASGGGTFHIVSLSDLLQLLNVDEAVVEEVRHQEAVARERVEVAVACPHCGGDTTFHIHPIPGASAKPVCPDCEQWFHAHWRDNGPPIVRRPHTVARTLPHRADVSVDCPYCGAGVVARIAETAGSSSIQTCGECQSRFHAHRRGDGSVFTHEWGGRDSNAPGESDVAGEASI